MGVALLPSCLLWCWTWLAVSIIAELSVGLPSGKVVSKVERVLGLCCVCNSIESKLFQCLLLLGCHGEFGAHQFVNCLLSSCLLIFLVEPKKQHLLLLESACLKIGCMQILELFNFQQLNHAGCMGTKCQHQQRLVFHALGYCQGACPNKWHGTIRPIP